MQGVIFDYGGVLVDMRWDVVRELEQAHALPERSIVETLYGLPSWQDVERGQGDRDAWLREAHETLERRADRPIPRLHEEWRASWHLIEPNIALVKRLRGLYRTAVLSNADHTLATRLRETHGIYDLFDDVVCSADVGLAKPDPRIYALSAERLALPPEACVFIDDTENNCVAAREAGMAAVHFRVDLGHSLEAQLAEHGIELAPV